MLSRVEWVGRDSEVGKGAVRSPHGELGDVLFSALTSRPSSNFEANQIACPAILPANWCPLAECESSRSEREFLKADVPPSAEIQQTAPGRVEINSRAEESFFT